MMVQMKQAVQAASRSRWRKRARSAPPTAVRASLAGKAAEGLTQLVLVTLVPRSFGPADYGVFAVALAVVAIGSSTAALGGPALLSRYVPAALPEERGGVALALAARLARVRGAEVLLVAVGATVLVSAAPHRFPTGVTLLA